MKKAVQTDPKSPVFVRMKKIIVEQLGVDEKDVVPQASFEEDLGADSLDVVELVMSLEEEFDLVISDDQAKELTTVSLALKYVLEHMK